jgi:hypothetical protein
MSPPRPRPRRKHFLRRGALIDRFVEAHKTAPKQIIPDLDAKRRAPWGATSNILRLRRRYGVNATSSDRIISDRPEVGEALPSGLDKWIAHAAGTLIFADWLEWLMRAT